MSQVNVTLDASELALLLATLDPRTPEAQALEAKLLEAQRRLAGLEHQPADDKDLLDLSGPEILTEDAQYVYKGDRIYNYYDCKWGIILEEPDDQGWFRALHEDGTSAILDGSRISTYDPKERNP